MRQLQHQDQQVRRRVTLAANRSNVTRQRRRRLALPPPHTKSCRGPSRMRFVSARFICCRRLLVRFRVGDPAATRRQAELQPATFDDSTSRRAKAFGVLDEFHRKRLRRHRHGRGRGSGKRRLARRDDHRRPARRAAAVQRRARRRSTYKDAVRKLFDGRDRRRRSARRAGRSRRVDVNNRLRRTIDAALRRPRR